MNEYRKLELPRKTGHKKEEYKYFVGTTLKNPLEYEIGEKIVFKIRPKFMDNYIDVPYISFLLISDDGKKEEGYIKSSDDGWFYVETSLSVSGFVYLKAVACDEHKNPIEDIEVFNGSAGADIKNICRCAEPPGDYSDFWQGLKEKVNKTEPELLYCKKLEDVSLPDYEIYDMRVKAPDNEYASVIVTYPKGALKGSLKFAMLFQGYGVNSAVPNAVEGYFVVSVNAHCMPNCEAEEFYANLRDNALKGYGFDKEENRYSFDESLSVSEVNHRREYDVLKGIYPDLDKKIAQRYAEIREGVFNEKNIEVIIQEISAGLEASGALLRDKPVWKEDGENTALLYEYICARLEYLDSYYNYNPEE